MKVKRLLSIIIVLGIMLQLGALAASDSHIECACGRKDCTCFIQLGDGGNSVRSIILLLKEQGFCAEEHSMVGFDAEVVAAVKCFQAEHSLVESGMLDDETLTLLLWGMTAEELDEKRPELDTTTVWIPTNGGTHRHRNSLCSNMLNPRLVSVRNAEALGFFACENCY